MKKLKSILFGMMLLCASAAFAGQVNINKADASTLAAELNGIGDKKAEAIVAYRKQHGPFKSIDDLQHIKGIGASTIEKNRKNISL